jgi:hypothetical protein
MNKPIRLRGHVYFLAGVLVGLLVVSIWYRFTSPTVLAMSQADATLSPPNIASMQAEIAHLKEVIPSQSHTMTDVGFQFANLWFAGRNKNWPLADFYFGETRQHISWTILIRPVRKGANGENVDLQPIFAMIDSGPLTKLRQSIDERDSEQFAASYRQTLNACHSCHIASGKPYLRLHIPVVPPQPLIAYESDEKPAAGASAR